MANDAVSRRLDAIFLALSHPTRRAMLARLAEGPTSVTELGYLSPISVNSISKHVKFLERAGFVEREHNGSKHRLLLRAEPFDEIVMFARTSPGQPRRPEPSTSNKAPPSVVALTAAFVEDMSRLMRAAALEAAGTALVAPRSPSRSAPQRRPRTRRRRKGQPRT